MTAPEHTVHLDRVTVGGCALRRRSATLRTSGGGDPEAPAGCPWWVHVSCARAPEQLQAGRVPTRLDARRVDGHRIRGTVTIVSRQDTAFGTDLVLAGVGPVDRLLES